MLTLTASPRTLTIPLPLTTGEYSLLNLPMGPVPFLCGWPLPCACCRVGKPRTRARAARARVEPRRAGGGGGGAGR